MPSPRSTIAAAVLALAAVACGNGGGVADGPSPSSSVTRCASFDPDCTETLDADTVELRGILFRPDRLEVAAGTTVTFDNLDPVAHTVTAGTKDAVEADRFDVDLAAGESTTLTFDEPGEIVYFCRIHPSTMIATIVVS